MNAFNNSKYYSLQKKAIEDRIAKFPAQLYLEIGGKFLYDQHAKNVLPGFDPEVKAKILKEFKDDMEILFCVNYDDILNNRSLKPNSNDFITEVESLLKLYEQYLGKKPLVVINNSKGKTNVLRIQNFISMVLKNGNSYFWRFFIENYPNSVDTILSENGFGKDDYIELNKKLIIVSGPASDSGKLSTALGQIYLDSIHNKNSGYAKFELFPIWNLPLDHPVNLAYEASTADIADYNLLDIYHKNAYGVDAINYNRDVKAFEILKRLAEKVVSEDNYIRAYKSPTDMGINMAGFCFNDDKAIRQAAYEEILSRKENYNKEITSGRGKIEWVNKCDDLIKYIQKNKLID